MKYTASCEWDSKECKLETTLFGVDSSVTYGGTPLLKDVKELISNVVCLSAFVLEQCWV